MTIPELKKIYGVLKKAYVALDEQAKIEGIDFTSPQYDELMSTVRNNILTKWGFSLEEYQVADQEYKDSKNTSVLSNVMNEGTIKVLQETQNDISKLKEVHIPTSEEITQIAHEVAKQYIKPPIITNRIVKEITIEKPQITKETIIEKTVETIAYNEKPLQEKLNEISRRVDEIKIPQQIDAIKLKEELGNEFSATLAYNIDILGMPNFRKLAMGIRQDLDSTISRVTALEANPGSGSGWTVSTPSGSLYDQATGTGGTSFTSVGTAAIVWADGATYFNGAGCTISGTSITMDNPVTQYIKVGV